MTEHTKRHPFLDDLADDVTLTASVLRGPATGKDLVHKIVAAGASQYLNQRPIFLERFGDRSYFEYEVDLIDNSKAEGLVSILRNAEGKVTRLNITFSPLDAVLSIASGIRKQLGDELDEGLI